jgi:hypothetical protein
MKWLASEFDFTTGRYTGDYYDLSTIDWFVDSDLGNDSTGTGSATNPWKTIGKLISDGSVINGHRVMINGIFTENTTISKQLRIIGCGGGRNGKTIFERNGVNFIRFSTNLRNWGLENIELINYVNTSSFITITSVGTIIGMVNCIFNNLRFDWNGFNGGFNYLNTYYCVFLNSIFQIEFGNAGFRIYVNNNNTFINCSRVGSVNARLTVQNNNHTNNTLVVLQEGTNNILNTNGQYFSITNNDFNFPATSPLYLTGKVDSITGIPANVGAGRLGNFLNTSKFEFTTVGGAAFTNTEVDDNYVYRSNDTIDGTFRSGIVDMGEIRRGVRIGINNSFQFTGGKLTKLIQETNGLTVRQGLDWKLIYGNSIGEIQTKITNNNWLLMEYGKIVTVTISGSTTYGNADTNFNPNNFITPSFRMFVVEMKFKNN